MTASVNAPCVRGPVLIWARTHFCGAGCLLLTSWATFDLQMFISDDLPTSRSLNPQQKPAAGTERRLNGAACPANRNQRLLPGAALDRGAAAGSSDAQQRHSEENHSPLRDLPVRPVPWRSRCCDLDHLLRLPESQISFCEISLWFDQTQT